jgi:CheY-like chemotaxis protein
MNRRRRTPTPILLLEGRSDRRAELAAALREADFDVTAVGDSQTAVGSLDTVRPRAVIANLDPPTRSDRIDFCRQIRDDPRTKTIPILLMAESLMEQDVQLATDPGVLVLTAPHDVAKLMGALNGVLAVQRAKPLSASLRRRRDMSRTA